MNLALRELKHEISDAPEIIRLAENCAKGAGSFEAASVAMSRHLQDRAIHDPALFQMLCRYVGRRLIELYR